MTTILETAAEMLRLDGLATEGEWYAHGESVGAVGLTKKYTSTLFCANDYDNGTGDDAVFVAFAHNHAPTLAREVLRLADEVTALRATVTWRQLDYEDGDTWECLGCGTQSIWEDAPEECDVKYCSYCGHPVRFEPYEDPGEDDELPAPPEDAA